MLRRVMMMNGFTKSLIGGMGVPSMRREETSLPLRVVSSRGLASSSSRATLRP